MFKLNFESKSNIIIIEEASIPGICGLVKGKDLALSIAIKVYENNKSKVGKLHSSYSKTWFTSCSSNVFKNFIIKFLSDVSYRDKHRLSLNSWSDEYVLNKEELEFLDTFIKENSSFIFCPIKKANVKSIDLCSESKYFNILVKKEAMNLLITDYELDTLSKAFIDKDELIEAVCKLIKGTPILDLFESKKDLVEA